MTKTLQVVLHKNDHFNMNEHFVMFLISKLIRCLIDGFTLGMKFQAIFNLLSIYI